MLVPCSVKMDRDVYLFILVVTFAAIQTPSANDLTSACTYSNGDITTSCVYLDLFCANGSFIAILNSICGIKNTSDIACFRHGSMKCNGQRECCRVENGDRTSEMPDIFHTQLSQNCSKQQQCHFAAPVQPLESLQNEIHFCFVRYKCITDTTPYSLTVTTDAIGPASTARPTEDQPLNLASVPVITIVVPISVAFVVLGIGLVLFWRIRRMKRKNPFGKTNKSSSQEQTQATYENTAIQQSTDANNQSLTMTETPENTVMSALSETQIFQNAVYLNDIVYSTQKDEYHDNKISSKNQFSPHTYFILEPQGQCDVEASKNSQKQILTECDDQISPDDTYNQVHFAKNLIIHNPDYDTLLKGKAQYVTEENVVYSHLGDNDLFENNELNYSHIGLKLPNRTEEDQENQYSHLEASVYRASIFQQNADEYSHLSRIRF